MLSQKRASALLNKSADIIHQKLVPKTGMKLSGKFALIRTNKATKEFIKKAQERELSKAEPRELIMTKGLKPGRYASLVEGLYDIDRLPDTVWMSTHHPERLSNLPVLQNAKGHVLIAGLGMGLIIYPLLMDRDVKSITVVEKNKDVIKLVEPYIHRLSYDYQNHDEFARPRCIINIHNADIFKFKPVPGYNTIYLDIWPTICLSNLKQIWKLKDRFKKHLAPGGWMGAWVEDFLIRKLEYTAKKQKPKHSGAQHEAAA
jgi:hypothetical protein